MLTKPRVLHTKEVMAAANLSGLTACSHTIFGCLAVAKNNISHAIISGTKQKDPSGSRLSASVQERVKAGRMSTTCTLYTIRRVVSPPPTLHMCNVGGLACAIIVKMQMRWTPFPSCQTAAVLTSYVNSSFRDSNLLALQRNAHQDLGGQTCISKRRWKALSLAAGPAGKAASGAGLLAQGPHSWASLMLQSASSGPQ